MRVVTRPGSMTGAGQMTDGDVMTDEVKLLSAIIGVCGALVVFALVMGTLAAMRGSGM